MQWFHSNLFMLPMHSSESPNSLASCVYNHSYICASFLITFLYRSSDFDLNRGGVIIVACRELHVSLWAMASAGDVNNKFSSGKFYLSVAVHSAVEPIFDEQLWLLYPIAKFFGHALYGKRRNCMFPCMVQAIVKHAACVYSYIAS